MATPLLTCLLVACVLVWRAHSLTLSLKLVHRFSDEARASAWASGGGGHWPSRRSAEYYRALVRSDLGRQKRRLGARYQNLFPSEGSETMSLGNDFGWCSLVFGASIMQEKDLGMYSPAKSKTSKYLSCSHELCASGLRCKSPKQDCPYTVNYYSENTSSSGLLVEDTLYLATNDDQTSVHSPVIIGCGRSQTGGYLEGAAPDGLLGLGFGNISVPSILARAGLVQNSFSMCFQDDDSGRIFFGDEGFPNQQSTPFVALDGKYLTYIVEVESFCIETRCLEKTNFQALVDSGSSFTSLPDIIYKRVTLEFNRQVNASRLVYDESPWEYCYKASPMEMPEVPTVTLMFAVNKSFVATNPIFLLYGNEGELAGFCLALQSSPDSLAIIGRHDLDDSSRVPLTPPPHNRPENPLPTDDQQRYPNGHAVSPAVAGRAPTKVRSAASPQVPPQVPSFLVLLLIQITVILTR